MKWRSLGGVELTADVVEKLSGVELIVGEMEEFGGVELTVDEVEKFGCGRIDSRESGEIWMG